MSTQQPPAGPPDPVAVQAGLDRVDRELAASTVSIPTVTALRIILRAVANARGVYQHPKDMTERSADFRVGVTISVLDTFARELAALGEDG